MENKDILRKKKFVLVTDAPFWEGKMGSHQRILTLVKSLAPICSLEVFVFNTIGKIRKEQIKKAGLENLIISYKNFDEHLKPEESNLPKLSSFNNIQGLKKRRFDAYYTTFAQYIAVTKPDIVLIEYIYLAYLQDAIPEECVKIIDTHDVMCFREYRFYQDKIHDAISMSVSYQEEKFVLNHFDAILAIQSYEYKILQKMLTNKFVILCPHSIPDYTNRYHLSNQIKNIGFIGSNNIANYNGLNWFIEQVWPVVKQLNVNLYIFGKVGERFQKYCDKDQSINIMLDALSQEEIYSMVDCMINPVLVGGGLKIKTLESLAYGKPIISSKEGSIGIDNKGENGILVAHNRSEFINHIVRLVKQPNLVGDLVEQGKNTINYQFSSHACYKNLIDFISYC